LPGVYDSVAIDKLVPESTAGAVETMPQGEG